MENKIEQAMDNAAKAAIQNAVDKVINECTWFDNEPSQSMKMRVSNSKKVMLNVWDEYLAYNEAIGSELNFERPSQWMDENIKGQLEGFIAYLQGLTENIDEADLRILRILIGLLGECLQTPR